MAFVAPNMQMKTVKQKSRDTSNNGLDEIIYDYEKNRNNDQSYSQNLVVNQLLNPKVKNKKSSTRSSLNIIHYNWYILTFDKSICLSR